MFVTALHGAICSIYKKGEEVGKKGLSSDVLRKEVLIFERKKKMGLCSSLLTTSEINPTTSGAMTSDKLKSMAICRAFEYSRWDNHASLVRHRCRASCLSYFFFGGRQVQMQMPTAPEPLEHDKITLIVGTEEVDPLVVMFA